MKAVAATSIIGVLGLVFGSMLFMMIVSGIRTTHPTTAPQPAHVQAFRG